MLVSCILSGKIFQLKNPQSVICIAQLTAESPSLSQSCHSSCRTRPPVAPRKVLRKASVCAVCVEYIWLCMTKMTLLFDLQSTWQPRKPPARCNCYPHALLKIKNIFLAYTEVDLPVAKVCYRLCYNPSSSSLLRYQRLGGRSIPWEKCTTRKSDLLSMVSAVLKPHVLLLKPNFTRASGYFLVYKAFPGASWMPHFAFLFFFPSCGSCELDVDRGVTVEQAFSGTNSFGKYSIFSKFCSEEGKKKLKEGRVLVSTIFFPSFFFGFPCSAHIIQRPKQLMH